MQRTLWLRVIRVFVLLALTGWCVADAVAQSVSLRVGQPPHYVGQPIVLQVVAEGFGEEPSPECRVAAVPAGVALRQAGVTPQTSEMIRWNNGNVSRVRKVTFTYQYELVAKQPGTISIGPFEVTQGQDVARTRSVTLPIQDLETSSAMRLALEVPARRLYVGERVPITIRMTYAGDIREVRELSIRSELFNRFTFEDASVDRPRYLLPIETPQGRLDLPATARQFEESGQPVVELTAERMLVADRVGEVDVGAIEASYKQVTHWARRSLFDDPFFGSSGPRPAKWLLRRAVGNTAQVVVRDVPTAGRPESFAGAIGSGFTVDASANRSVVEVGDPITLTITVRGQGNLKEIRLPPLATPTQLPPTAFRVPSGEVPGVFQRGEKQFRVTVRAADAGVKQIPRIAFAWFDPASESFETTQSKPIALEVHQGAAVSSQDVFSSRSSADRAIGRGDSADEAVSQPNLSGGSYAGADLAIEYRVDRLLNSPSGLNRVAAPAAYVLGIALVVLAVVDKRRRQADPQTVARQKLIAEQRRRIRDAVSRQDRASGEVIADALRQLISVARDEEKRQGQQLLADLETEIYAPGDSRRENSAVIEQAVAFAEKLSR